MAKTTEDDTTGAVSAPPDEPLDTMEDRTDTPASTTPASSVMEPAAGEPVTAADGEPLAVTAHAIGS